MKQAIKKVIAFVLFIGLGVISYAQSGVRYPYVKDGNIIVSRDSKGGVKATNIHPNWTTDGSMRPHSEEEDVNRVAAKFEIGTSDAATNVAWGSTNANCTYPWRRPTQRELILIYLMRKSLTVTLASTWYWGSTANAGANHPWCLNISNGWITDADHTNGTANVRCIRDID